VLLPFVFPPDFLFAFDSGLRNLIGFPQVAFLRTTTGFASIYAALERTPPPFTLRLLKSFVNRKRAVSTGFYRVLPGFSGFRLFSVPL
jgi:hypothetical protein